MISTEKKLRESEERFKALFKMSPIPTYAWQKVGVSFKLIDYNNAADIITQGNVQNYLGIKASEMYRESLDIIEDINRCFDKKTTVVREMKYFFSSLKEEKDLLVKYAFLPPDLVLVHTEDITDRKRAEEKIQYQAKLVEDVSDAIISSDLDFNIVSWNKAAESIYGWKAEEVIGKNIMDTITVEYPYDDQEAVLKQFFEEGFWKGEVIQPRKDGTPINILTSVSLIKDIKGNQVGAVAINRDISERKLVEQKLKESEIIFRDLYEEAPNAYFSIGPEKSIIRTNKAAKRLLGYTEEEFSKLNVFELYTDTKYGLKKAEKVFQQFKNGETIKDIELQMKHKNGDPVWVSLFVKPIFDSDGRVIESRSMVLDITDRKNTEEALKKSETKYKEAYDKANFYKDLFTHDMNNILQIINSSAEIIGFQLGDSEMSMYIENLTKIIKNQVDRGSKLISNVRTLTELDEQEEISTKQVNISKFLNSSINFVKKAYIGKNISIFAEKLDQKYYTNANELLQDVFDNILINSVKYNENLEVEISIKISKQIMDGKNYFKFELSDNGIGVPDDRKDVIFQPGNRELKGTKGMGIGLSLVKKILEIFEGKIWVEDKIKGDYAKGSNFVVLLPEVN